MLDKILKAVIPVDIPFLQQIKFELIVDLKTANAMGLEFRAKPALAPATCPFVAADRKW